MYLKLAVIIRTSSFSEDVLCRLFMVVMCLNLLVIIRIISDIDPRTSFTSNLD